jgi:hypothetical protein
MVCEDDDVIAHTRASRRLTEYPFGNGGGVAARTRAADDDRNLQLCHGYLSVDSVVRSWYAKDGWCSRPIQEVSTRSPRAEIGSEPCSVRNAITRLHDISI